MTTRQQRVEADLAAIRTAMADGNVEDATAKLGAITENVLPGSTFSKEVGDLYMQLGFVAMAGRYWYLLDDKSEEMVTACKEFEHSLGNSPTLIFLTFPWHDDPLPSAIKKMEELNRCAWDFRHKHHLYVKPSRDLRDRVALLGCAIVCFVVLFVLIMGGVFIASWFR